MSNIIVKNGLGTGAYLKANGTGTDLDPFVPVQDVTLQDQTTPTIIVPFHSSVATTTIGAATTVGSRVITVASSAGFIVGHYLSMFNVAAGHWFGARITVIDVDTVTVTVNVPVCYVFGIGDVVGTGSTDMNINGSVTPQHFHIRYPDPGVPVIGDITRVTLIMETSAAPAWDQFGNIAALTNGIVLRKDSGDGTYRNIFDARSNAELAAIMYDFEAIDAAKFTTSYGVKGRLTFGGQSKLGVVIRIDINEDLEVIIQDDLTGLDRFVMLAQGSVVLDG